MIKVAKKDRRPSAAGKIPATNSGPVMVPIDQLSPYPRNARTHSKKQISQIAACIEASGFLGSILADANGVIMAGHGRLEAARLLGMPEVPVTYVSHLTDAQVKAFRIADNRLAEQAGWSVEALRIEFEDLAALTLDFSLEITGFEIAQINSLSDPKPSNKKPSAVRKRAKLADTLPVSQAGDVWLLGPHQLMCSPLLDPDPRSDRLKLMDSNAEFAAVDLIVRRWEELTSEHARLGVTGETFAALTARRGSLDSKVRRGS